MKTILISLLAALMGVATPVLAQSDQYKQAMTDALTTLKGQNMQTGPADLLASANQFERIAGVETKEWLPRYYAGLSYIYLGFMGKDAKEKDAYLDKADLNLKAAEAIADNDELAVLKAYIAQARMAVDPMSRWQQYGPPFQTNIEKAMRLNPENPRPYVLQGSSLMYTPEEFGGGPKNACPVLQKAAEKFATFKPVGELHPTWGQKQIEPMLVKCK
jgi:hypothetical protein